MAPPGRRLVHSRLWPGAVALGPAALIPSSLGVAWLAQGGLAPLAVAAVVALFIGAPVASAEWRAARHFADPSSRPGAGGALGRGLFALSDVLATLLVAAVAAPLILSAGWTGQAFAVVGWLSTIVAARRIGAGLAVALALLCAGFAIVGAVVSVGTPPWTLLEPQWASWRTWLPGAIVLGVLATPVGLGQWATGPALPPGAGRIAWATTGLAIWIAVCVAVRQATLYEASLGRPFVGPGGEEIPLSLDPIGAITLGLAVFAAAAAVVARRGADRDRLTRAALGWLGTLWFTGPGSEATAFFLLVLLPVGLAVVLGAVARHGDGIARWTAGLAAVGCLGAALTGPATLPDSIGGAGSVALTLVAIFWYVATRAVDE